LTFTALRETQVIRLLAISALLGQYWLSFILIAVQHAEIGVASTLMALSLIILPISYFVFKEKSAGRRSWGQCLRLQESQYYSCIIRMRIFFNQLGATVRCEQV
jgi:hypothetical protein